MRIAYITADPGVPVFGRKGCSIHVQEVLRGMARLGAEIDLFATHSEGAPPAGLTDVHVRPLAPPPKGDLAFREQQCLGANASLHAALQSAGPFDLVYERYSIWSFAGMDYARATATPGFLEVNAPLIDEQAEHRGLVDRAGAERAAERAFEAATALIAVSDEVAEYLERFPAARGKTHVVPNGVNPGRFPPDLKATCPAPTGTFTVGFVGSMKPWHGLDQLLEAFALFERRLPGNRLLMVGDGVGRAQLATVAEARGLGKAVQFTGAVPAAEVPGFLASMDVGVAPYPQQEDFYFSPLKVYEYMAAGLPVVASRIGQLKKLIEPERTGLLVPPGDVQALATALERIRSEPDLRHRLGQTARAKVLRDHTWDGAVEAILRLAGIDTGGHLKGSRHAHVTT